MKIRTAGQISTLFTANKFRPACDIDISQHGSGFKVRKGFKKNFGFAKKFEPLIPF